MFVLAAADGQQVKLTMAAAHLSQFVKNMLEAQSLDFGGHESVPTEDSNEHENDNDIPFVPYDILTLQKVVTFCEYHVHHPLPEIKKPIYDTTLKGLDDFYHDLIDSCNPRQLANLLKAADFLEIGPLQDLCSAKFAAIIGERTLDEVRTTFSQLFINNNNRIL
eukprot:Lankesteria_metandrocarpae@DN593_c0_g1_i1.p1